MTEVAAIRARIRAGDPVGALALAREAAEQDGASADVHAIFGSLLAQRGDVVDAVRAFERALVADPSHLDARFDLALLLLRSRPDVAAGLLAEVLAARPGDVDARVNRGVALAALSRWDEAAAALTEAVSLAPGRADAWMALGTAEATRARHDRAHAAFERALALDGLQGHWWTRAGWHALTCGDLDAARARFERAALLRSEDPEPVAGLATVDDREGDPARGLARLAPHLAQAPRSPRLAEVLGQLSLRLGQPDAALPLVRAARAGTQEAGAARRLDHTLGALLDATGDGEAALACWLRAGRASPWRDAPDAFDGVVDGVVRHHTRAALRPGPDAAPGPVLIVGLPRTGTSLLEQMLDRHTGIAGAGELQAGVEMAEGLGPDWPTRVPLLGPDDLRRLAARWRAEAGDAAPLVTDKLPLNALHLGVFARALPGTRVLWCLRDPRDLAVSNLAQPFSGPRYAWTTTLEGIARRVAAHHRLATHWAAHLPLPLHFVRYGDLVGRPEPVMRGILGFLGLAEEAACLAPHRSTRALNTASFAQIREPIHTRSVARWRRCAAGLQPLIDALGPLTDPRVWPA